MKHNDAFKNILDYPDVLEIHPVYAAVGTLGKGNLLLFPTARQGHRQDGERVTGP